MGTPNFELEYQRIACWLRRQTRWTKRLTGLLAPLNPLEKKRRLSEPSFKIALRFEPPGKHLQHNIVQSQLRDNRQKSMYSLRDRVLRGSFRSPNQHDVEWNKIRACIIFFPLSAYFATKFLQVAIKLTNNLQFGRKLDSFLEQTDHWCKQDFLDSLKSVPFTVEMIEEVLGYTATPVKFTIQGIQGCSWQEVVSEALYLDLLEAVDVFVDSTVVRELLLLDDDMLQEVVNVVEFLIVHVDPCDSRKLDRFLKLIVEKRGILPSKIFLNDVCRVGSNYVHGGGFADVWKGDHEDKEKMQLEFIKEALLWRKLIHPNVLPFLGICRDEFAPQIALVSHWMEKGSLVEYLTKSPSADCLKLALGIARGLQYLHGLTPRVIHGDLRAANVLIDENDEPRITDFGLARVVDSQGTSIATSFKGRGTLRWQAPELLNASRFGQDMNKLTTKTDVYAFSCVCLEIFTGKVPFSELRDGAVIMEVAVHDRRPAWPGSSAVIKGLTDFVWAIMNICWKTKPADRPEIPFVVSSLESAGLQASIVDAH
ncbi:kinase-like protein [Sanghuangporus baumii]|uniref:Kinase-like protein n=1 Tax=Sanghuangporus baumii TaxID=108892 RepID=A0A9Q5HX38_SANBA|nr:kinase-like protein [Sanghuangporus baumii]